VLVRNTNRLRHYLARCVDMQGETNRLLSGIRLVLWVIAILLAVGMYTIGQKYRL
jgi:hypothetical protein